MSATIHTPRKAHQQTAQLDRLAARWSRAGAFLTVAPTTVSIDLEQLICDTATASRASERLFVVAASWLAAHHLFVNGRRLAALARQLATAPAESGIASAALGALLDVAIAGAHRSGGPPPDALVAARSVCQPLADQNLPARPFFLAMSNRRSLRERMRRTTTPLFAHWGLWHDDSATKPESVRPVSWIMARTPELRVRALLGATLEAELLWAALLHNEQQADGRHHMTDGPTVSSVAAFAAASYAGTHEAAERLVRRGLLVRTRDGVRQLLQPTESAVAIIGPITSKRRSTAKVA